MALEVTHIKTENTHENIQFRRVATKLIEFFDQQNWDGILIGNPVSENFQRFRADAILLYNNGLIIIDFKDYSGKIELPETKETFEGTSWYIDTLEDKNRIIIKAGSKHINPFRQLRSYRSEFFNVINSDITLGNNINPGHVCTLNIFSGPIEVKGKTPGKFRYYSILEEKELFNFLVDYSSDNSFSEASKEALKRHFPAEPWVQNHFIDYSHQEDEEQQDFEMEAEPKKVIDSFLEDEDASVLVLQSMNSGKRDDWLKYILYYDSEKSARQTETWCHSTRIARRLKDRNEISVPSIYTIIYGGTTDLDNETDFDGQESAEVKTEAEATNEEKTPVENVPLSSSQGLDDSAVIVVQEAHLLTSSMHRSEILQFGSGRLLDDLFQYMDLEKKDRKLIFIGDPYSLSYGSIEESALHLEHLQSLVTKGIMNYREPLDNNAINGIHELRIGLADSIERQKFNRLQYPQNELSINLVDKSAVNYKFEEWFSVPLTNKPNYAGLFYKRESAYEANLHIKEQFLRNSEEIAKDDLILVDNNIWITERDGLSEPVRILNGMYLLIKEIGNEEFFSISASKFPKPIVLKFLKLTVSCLNLTNKPEKEVWLNLNYFLSSGDLSKEEQIAFRIFRGQRLAELKLSKPFEDSFHYKEMIKSSDYNRLTHEVDELKNQLSKGEKVKTKLDARERELRKIIRRFTKLYQRELLLHLYRTDPFLNAVNGSYGWCTTIHKAIAADFDEVVLNADRGMNQQITNEEYFRWLYSGLTSAKTIAHVINPQEVSLFSNCDFEDMVGLGPSEKKNTKKIPFDFTADSISEEYVEFLGSVTNEQTKVAISKLCQVLGSSNLELTKVKKFTEYLTKISLSTKGADSISRTVLFNNNGKGEVTSIRIENEKETDFDKHVNQAIKRLERKIVQADEPMPFPDDFRGNFYRTLAGRCNFEEASLSLIKEHDFKDILLLKQGKEYLRFEMIYRKSEIFTHVKVLEKSTSKLSVLLNELIFHYD